MNMFAVVLLALVASTAALPTSRTPHQRFLERLTQTTNVRDVDAEAKATTAMLSEMTAKQMDFNGRMNKVYEVADMASSVNSAAKIFGGSGLIKTGSLMGLDTAIHLFIAWRVSSWIQTHATYAAMDKLKTAANQMAAKNKKGAYLMPMLWRSGTAETAWAAGCWSDNDVLKQEASLYATFMQAMQDKMATDCFAEINFLLEMWGHTLFNLFSKSQTCTPTGDTAKLIHGKSDNLCCLKAPVTKEDVVKIELGFIKGLVYYALRSSIPIDKPQLKKDFSSAKAFAKTAWKAISGTTSTWYAKLKQTVTGGSAKKCAAFVESNGSLLKEPKFSCPWGGK